MKISQSFEVARPLPAVWELFQDVPAVAACMPGAELTENKGDGVYAGRVGIKLGPFGASFEGEAQVTADPASFVGRAEGRGIDKKGGSRSRLVMDYQLKEAGSATLVSIDADIQLAGPIAQFGRTGIVTETANVLIGQFVKNVEARLSGEASEASSQSNEISALKVAGMVMKSYFKRSGS